MDTSTADSSVSAGAEQPSLNPAMLDRFVGYYRRNRAVGVSTITRRDTRLFLEPIGQPPMELEPIGEAEFAIQQYRIALGDDGKVYGFTEASSEAQRRALI